MQLSHSSKRMSEMIFIVIVKAFKLLAVRRWMSC